MSQPTKIFQKNTPPICTGKLSSLQHYVQHWQNLNPYLYPILPQPEQWQIVRYQSGILTVMGKNQAMVSRLNYLQWQYTQQLAQLEPFYGLQKIRAILTPTPKQNTLPQLKKTRCLTNTTKVHLAEAAACVENSELKQALLKLAQSDQSSH